MKISYNWLKEYIKTGLSPEEIAEILTNNGLEVESIKKFEAVRGRLKGVVIGEILSCEPHPNADHLKKTIVNIGREKPLYIVCGAPNVASGEKVPIATVGTIIYTKGGNFTIEKRKIRGKVSEGMICSENELGLGDSHESVMVLDENAQVGIPIVEYFKMESDYVLEIDLTPNRTDAMSHYGVARDLKAALLCHGHKNVELNLPSVSSFRVTSHDLLIDIQIEDSEACPRYAGVSFKNVKVSPSPDWLQDRLRAIDVSPINNIVDITNYVLYETGHPLHAFDANQIIGHKVIVKHLLSGTKFVTLDEKERKLHKDDLMVCNEKDGMAIAGVLGGKKSGVSKETTCVFLESAYFKPIGICKTAKRHDVNTDASLRYERGVDPNMSLYALKRAAIFIRDIAEGEIATEINDVYPRPIKDKEITLNLDRMYRLIGQKIQPEKLWNIFSSLDIKIKIESTHDHEMILSVPPYRADVTREADVIEEVLRIYGFNSIEVSSKMSISVSTTDAQTERQYREKISSLLINHGFNEIINNSLTKSIYYEGNGFKAEESVEIINPLSQDLTVMRQNLLFGGLEVIVYNCKRQRTNLRLYEFGKVYRKNAEGYIEQRKLSLWTTGLQQPENWKNGSLKTDFYYLKTEIESILKNLGFKWWEEKEANNPLLNYGLSLYFNKRKIAVLGKVNPISAKKLDVKQEVFYADLDWDYLNANAQKNKFAFSELPKHLEVRRDLALLLNKNIKYSDLKATAEKAERKLLRQINLFDVYEDKNLPDDKKSYALSFILQDENKTLNDKEVDKVMKKIQIALEKEHQAILR